MGAFWGPNGSVWGCSGEGKPCENDGGVIKITLLDICSLSRDMRRVLAADFRCFFAENWLIGQILRPLGAISGPLGTILVPF